jgi:hypothetical protein
LDEGKITIFINKNNNKKEKVVGTLISGVTPQVAHATTKISPPSCPKRLVVAKLIGWCVLLKL